MDNAIIDVDLPEELIDQLLRIAERTQRPLATIIELACRAYIHWHAAGTSEEEQ